MTFQLLTIMAPIFFAIAIGFTWVRMKGSFDNAFVGALVMYVGTPCLLLRTFNQIPISPQAFFEMGLAALLVMTFMGLGGAIALKALGLSLRDFLPALMFPNTANMGLPVVLFAYGEQGLAFGIVVFVINVVAHYTLGIGITIGKMDGRTLRRLPVIYAVFVGLALMWTELSLPAWLANTVNMLGSLTIPLMLLALGVALARLPVGGLPISLKVTLLRIAGGFAAAMLAAQILQLGGVARGVLILQATMPVAVLSYLLADRFGSAGSEVAGAVVVSTIVSFVTIPTLIWLLTV